MGESKDRIQRLFTVRRNALEKALELDADIYHLHDPELLLIAKRLIKAGKVVIYDAHEDLVKQIKAKAYLNKRLRKLVSLAAKSYLSYILKKIPVVAATPYIEELFKKTSPKVVNINNYPIIEEFSKKSLNEEKSPLP